MITKSLIFKVILKKVLKKERTHILTKFRTGSLSGPAGRDSGRDLGRGVYGPTVAPWHHSLPKRIKNTLLENSPKANLSFEGVLRASGAWEYAGTIGSGYSFAHAKYGANP